MPGKNRTIFGIYPNRTTAETGVDALKSAGFRNTDISVLFPEECRGSGGTEELVIERRPGSEAVDVGHIGDHRELRVPLTEERVKVQTRPVVREELEVGKCLSRRSTT